MKSKIEKLEEFNWLEGRDSLTIAFDNTIIRKVNEIIDYLNSQSQPEEYAERIRIKGEIKDLNELATQKVKEVGSARLVKDTPEEWGEEFDRLYRTSIGTLELKDYVKQLLEDKEKETITTFLKDTASYNHFYKGEPRVMENNKGEGYEITVNLLNNKKK